jgi:hypothetical protein
MRDGTRSGHRARRLGNIGLNFRLEKRFPRSVGVFIAAALYGESQLNKPRPSSHGYPRPKGVTPKDFFFDLKSVFLLQCLQSDITLTLSLQRLRRNHDGG